MKNKSSSLIIWLLFAFQGCILYQDKGCIQAVMDNTHTHLQDKLPVSSDMSSYYSGEVVTKVLPPEEWEMRTSCIICIRLHQHQS